MAGIAQRVNRQGCRFSRAGPGMAHRGDPRSNACVRVHRAQARCQVVGQEALGYLALFQVTRCQSGTYGSRNRRNGYVRNPRTARSKDRSLVSLDSSCTAPVQLLRTQLLHHFSRWRNHMYRITRSLITEGRSLPTTCVSTSSVSCVPRFTCATCLTLARACIRDPAGTGAGKRKRSEP